ncbi:MAG: SDR family NAD(P)-dependent oxidoreductase, partial [Candidatus Methanomethylophilaceae archaeon]|nr:SDR family NAD(P)-dependent oxidoreductase [Candidatus Methanomethylophilaceae archaeon]
MARALVTGASGGIGKELSLILARNGYDLVIVARRQKELEELRDVIAAQYARVVEIVACDLTDISAVELMPTDVDILINNAGFGDLGPFVDCDPDKQIRMI